MSDREHLLRAIQEVRERAESMSPKPAARAAHARYDELTVRLGPGALAAPSSPPARAARAAPTARFGPALVIGVALAVIGASTIVTRWRAEPPAPARAAQSEPKPARAAAPAPTPRPEPAPSSAAAANTPSSPRLEATRQRPIPPSARGAHDEPVRPARSRSPRPAASWWW